MRTAASIAIALLLIGAGCTRATVAPNPEPPPIPPEIYDPAPAIPPNAPPPTTPPPTVVVPPSPPPGTNTPPPPAAEAPRAPRVIRVTAKQWEFVPAEIRVRNGESIVLEVTSTDVDHGLALPDFGINRTLKPGTTERIAFTPDKFGSFSMICSVYCGKDHRMMRGTLIVE